jgi:apolipoprotein D and lipocalin family protein
MSRDITLPEDVKEKYLESAKTVGYKTDDLIWVKHNK